MPGVLEHVWGWFMELNATRSGGFGPGAISYQEMDAWSRLTGQKPTPFEVSLIRRLDGEYHKYQAEKQEKE